MPALCLFGGAFDPPHRTHLRIVAAALAQLPVERLVVVPTGEHPHKGNCGMASAADRLELCQLAFGGLDRVEISDFEVRRNRASYTVETLEYFREYVTAGERPYWIIGADNLAILPTWHRHRDVLRLAVLVTFPRLGFAVTEQLLNGLDLSDAQRAEITTHVLETAADNVSSSEIRRRIGAGIDADELLPPAVAQRIRELGLYREASG